MIRSVPAQRWVLLAALLLPPLFAPCAWAQHDSRSKASSAANAAGTTVNNQSNTQVNTTTFFGFGPGINCPTPALSLSAFAGGGSGSSEGVRIGADVNSATYGGLLTYSMPLGGANTGICREIGRAQVENLQAQAARSRVETAKTQADLYLTTAQRCAELQQVARLSGPFAMVCDGVDVRGRQVSALTAAPGSVAAPASAPARASVPPQPALLQRFNP